jgi:hypothetical protein
MRLPKRDLIATVFVAIAVLVYLMWAVDSAFPGTGSARVAGVVVLALGFAASASAVVPSFSGLLHGSKAYLAATSVLGTAAFVGGLLTLLSANAWGFAVMIAATIALWLISTVHHWLLARNAASATCPTCGRPTPQRFCDVCGYDVIEQTRASAAHLPHM